MIKKESLRNLPQYKDLSDDEFEEVWAKRLLGALPIKEFESRIERMLKKFEDDYDISDMKINDMRSLRALIQAIISLDDYETIAYKLRQNTTSENIVMLDRLNKLMSGLRADISRLQADLNITRKVRKTGKESSVINFIENLKKKARKFYQSRMIYIFCPKCGNLVATVWLQYPHHSRNRLTFICNKRQPDGQRCDTTFTVRTKEIYEAGSNRPELLPREML